MERLMRSFPSWRRRRETSLEASKPYIWQEDERRVRDGSCHFAVKYLGCVEVFDSRGIQVCEEAISVLRNNKALCQHAILYVSGDALRVIDDLSKGLIVDQTIEKVSFCAPDRNSDRGFAYICRDGTSRRWMCHAFIASKDTGERLSHAVGCAFTICLERKQQRDREKAAAMATVMSHSLGGRGRGLARPARNSSFRQTSLAERLTDPQSAIVAEPVPVNPQRIDNPFAIERPHAPAELISRYASFHGFDKLPGGSSPFKRNLSLPPSTTRPSCTQHRPPTDRTPMSPVAENEATCSSSPEPVRCLTRLCQQYTTSPVRPLPCVSTTATPVHAPPCTVSSSTAPVQPVPCEPLYATPVHTLPCTAPSTATAPVLPLPCGVTSSGGVVTSVWGCPLKTTAVTILPNDAGCKVELSAAELWLRNTANVLDMSRSQSNDLEAKVTAKVEPSSANASSNVVNPFFVAFDRSTTVFQTHL